MKKSIVLLFSFLLVTSVAIAAPIFKIKQTTQVQNQQDYVAGQILVKFRAGTDDTKVINSYSSSVIGEDARGGFKYISIPADKTVEEMVATYSSDPNVLYAEPDYIYRSYAVPNDPFYIYQWHMPMINMEQAWDQNTGSGVVVAVLDVGVAYENFGSFAQAPDLAQTNFVAGYDFINNDAHANDDNGHGTHVTGTIAQSTNNNLGVAGIAYNASIMPVKVLDGAGSGASSVIANGIYFAADNGAQVINMSLGSSFLSTTIQDACNYAKNKGVILICAAGNSGRRVLEYPAALDACMSVSSVRFDSTLASYSTYNDSVDITAPGGDTSIDQDGDGYVDGVLQQTHDGINFSTFSYYFYQGTSMACPHVAGAAASVISASGGTLTPDEVQAILENSTVDLGAAGWDNRYGHGLLDVNAALLSVGSNTNPPIADFSGTPLSGTVPLTVSFSDLSTDAPTSWTWDFGDGGTSSAQNPSYTYNTSGTYTVSLTATNANGSNTKTSVNYITVNPCVNPTASFSGTPTTGTEPLTVNFTDGSSGASSWSWDFGDGGTSTAQNPSYTYAGAGTYTVSLTATNSCGSNTSTMTNYITVNPCVMPTAGFSGTPLSGDYPLTVSFTDGSNGAASYAWDFGDASTSTASNPSHTYTAAGTYTVSQTVTNSCGSNTSTQVNYITVTTPPCNAPVASFGGTPTTGDYPLTVSFTDGSTNTPTSWTWDFGDGGTSTTQNPSYTYNTAGTFTVSMTATNSCGSNSSTMTNYITVTTPPCNAPVASFSGSPTSGNAPLSVSFTDGSTNAPTSWTWDFGDGGTSSAQNPTYTYNAAGTYTVAMTATNSCGSNSSTMTNYITVNSGPVTGEGFILSRNADFSTDDRSFGNNETMYVKMWTDQVDFNDISRARFELRNPNGDKVRTNLTNNFDNTYTGSFNMSGLPTNDVTWDWKGEIKDNPGNRYKPTTVITITAGPPPAPVADFSASPTTGFAPLAVTFSDLSSNSPTSWAWDFGDGGTSTVQNPSHSYASAGSYTVSLTATNAGGTNTNTKVNYITANVCTPPTAGFTGTPTTGDAPLAVSFSDASTGATSWTWDFGDGGSSNAQNPNYTYATPGTYSVSLTASNSCGNNTSTMTNYITVNTPPCNPPVASFSGTPTTGNAPLNVSFSDATSNSPTSWVWDFGDGGTSNAQNPTYSYSTAGTYTVSMTASNACGTNTSTMTNYITVNAGGPVTGEGFILSRNADFSTDDRNFNNNEIMYVKLWSDVVDFNDISRARFEMKDANKNRTRINFTNNFDGSYTGQMDLMNLPSGAASWTWKGEAKDNAGNRYKPSTNVTVNMIASNGNSTLLVETFGLRQNYPNPFNPTTSVSFMLATTSTIKLEVYNTNGQKVETLASGRYSAGQHTFEFDASNLSSGVYLYKLTTDGIVETKKMLLLK